MARLDCALAESQLKPLAETPLLSIVVLSYRRAGELKLAVESLAGQLGGGLGERVEIIVSDNASGGATLELVRALAAEHPSVSYVAHARNEGGYFNMFAAPWRARGRYCWMFGSDDLLLEGGVAEVVRRLDEEAPSFLTLNKRAAEPDLAKLVWERANSVPDARFDGFVELFCALGLNQLAFISCQVEDTARARSLDAERYLQADTRHPHVAAFLEKHHGRLCIYSAANHVVHRLNNSDILDYHSGNFLDYAAMLPCLLWQVMKRVDAPLDLLERVTGCKRIESYDPPALTFIDHMFENILRACGAGLYIRDAHRRTLEEMLQHCRPDRSAQLAEILAFTWQAMEVERRKNAAVAALDQVRATALQGAAMFRQPTAP